MSGPDLTKLSSNWKNLQAKLQAEKKTKAESNGVKRKRPTEKAERPNGPTKHKKVKVSAEKPNFHTRPSKMGLSSSKESESQTPSEAKDTPISSTPDPAPKDLPTNAATIHEGSINGGLSTQTKPGKYISIDCEFVGTGPPPHSDHVLARVSLVNYHGAQIYDSYVLPPLGIKVTDYRTWVSGIQPQHLQPSSARPYVQVRQEVAALLEGRVLVGHAVRNDLQVLQLKHPLPDVRDTSRYPAFRKLGAGPPGLRFLAKKVLGLEIQTGEHSSLEDARATMALFRHERKGFEEEVRRRFGPGVGKKKGSAGNLAKASTDAASVRDDESDDFDALSGDAEDEDDDDAEEEVPKQSAAKGKKKRKKKKRTKR